MPDDELERRDYEALLATRRELGPDYEAALVDSFADRIEQEIQRRVAATSGGISQRHAGGGRQRQLALGIVSLGVGIPITAISAGIADLPAAGRLGGIVAVNVATPAGRRRDESWLSATTVTTAAVAPRSAGSITATADGRLGDVGDDRAQVREQRSASTVRATPCAPPPIETVPSMLASAIYRPVPSRCPAG